MNEMLQDLEMLANLLRKHWGMQGGQAVARALEDATASEEIMLLRGECILLRATVSDAEDILSSVLHTLEASLLVASTKVRHVRDPHPLFAGLV
jgi:hypothetical protein